MTMENETRLDEGQRVRNTTNATILALLDADDYVKQWFIDADADGWECLDVFADEAMEVHGELHGFCYCTHCDAPLVDASISIGCEREAIHLCGDITLCAECYEAAKEARKKIVIVDDGDCEHEDDSALSDSERELAGYLDRAEQALNRIQRGLIGSYPRDERRQLHRYQDAIEADRSRAGKAVE